MPKKRYVTGNRETRAPLSPKYKDHGPALLSRFWLRVRRVYTDGWPR